MNRRVLTVAFALLLALAGVVGGPSPAALVRA